MLRILCFRVMGLVFILMGMIKKCAFLFFGGARDSVSPYAKCDIVLRRMPYILVL